MITFLATKPHTYTIERYLETWGKPLAERFRVMSYESWLGDAPFEARPGTYIFSDIERLNPSGAERIGRAWKAISDLGGKARTLNHPTRSMRRYELLWTLFERGDNTFEVCRMVACRQPQRWPVFIRHENNHTKNLTPLLNTPEELEAAIDWVSETGRSRENKLVVEFCDTRDDQGLFYKYSAFMVGERVIPWHLWASPRWVVAGRTRVKTPETLEKERRYVETNPHERELREIFRLARIEYGKIDYSMLGDRLQVWEINTNPNTGGSSFTDDSERKTMAQRRAEHFAAAFAEIDIRNYDNPRA